MNTKTILKRLRLVRIKKGWSQRKLAKQLEMSPQYYSYIERGVTPLRMDYFLRACEILETDSVVLLEGGIKTILRNSIEEKLTRLSKRDFFLIEKILDIMLSEEASAAEG